MKDKIENDQGVKVKINGEWITYPSVIKQILWLESQLKEESKFKMKVIDILNKNLMKDEYKVIEIQHLITQTKEDERAK